MVYIIYNMPNILFINTEPWELTSIDYTVKWKKLIYKIKVPMVISVVDFVIIKLKSLQLLDQVHVMQHDLMHWMAMVNFSYVFKIWQWIALPIG